MFQQFVEIPSMKKFTLKAITLATASICGSAAFAGTIVAPAVGSATPYAVESMTNTTDITLPAVTYRMGVSRTTAQDFTMIFKPSAGSTFTQPCPAGANVTLTAGTGAITVSNKRHDPTECAYEVDVTTATDLTTEITITGLTLDTHALASGTAASVVLGLWELAENARIDNTSDLSRVVATSGNALTLTAAQDTATTTDVNHTEGPLFGFVADGDDSASTATASFMIGNNSGATTFMLPDGVTPWDFTSDGTELTITVTGSFQGLEDDGFTYSGDLGSGTADVSGNTATFSFLPGDFSGTGSYTVSTSFLSAMTASLGTSRTFGVSGVGDVATGADVALAGNAAWWVWDANASQLVSPFFNTNPNYITRFFFLNTGANAVGYTVQCYTENGGAVTNGAGGTLAGNATTNITASSVCTFPANAPRGGVVFTINAPIGDIKGTYQQISPTGADGVVQPLLRPYNANTTE
jgi:hypothetical protein